MGDSGREGLPSEGPRETVSEAAASYLQQLQGLRHEISNAIDAIASDALPKLQESIAKQEMLCSRLATTAKEVSIGCAGPGQPPYPTIDKSIETKIRAAYGAIRELTLQYSALLKHSGHSIALLSLLCKSHAGQFQEVRGARLKRQTWSCEM
jgi:hypothetical protein